MIKGKDLKVGDVFVVVSGFEKHAARNSIYRKISRGYEVLETENGALYFRPVSPLTMEGLWLGSRLKRYDYKYWGRGLEHDDILLIPVLAAWATQSKAKMPDHSKNRKKNTRCRS